MAQAITVSVIRGLGVIDRDNPGRSFLAASAAQTRGLVVERIVSVDAASAVSILGAAAGGAVIKYETEDGRATDELTVTENAAAIITAMG